MFDLVNCLTEAINCSRHCSAIPCLATCSHHFINKSLGTQHRNHLFAFALYYPTFTSTPHTTYNPSWLWCGRKPMWWLGEQTNSTQAAPEFRIKLGSLVLRQQLHHAAFHIFAASYVLPIPVGILDL